MLDCQNATPCAQDSPSRRFSASRKLTVGFWCRSKRLWILRRNWRGRRIDFMSAVSNVIPLERIERAILLIRGQKVMLDSDLARLYEVETRVLNQAVKRNADRFPEDFMFQLTQEEAAAVLNSRSQFVILKRGENIKYLPHVFTEQGVAMLSSVL